MEPLKEMFNKVYYDKLANAITAIHPEFEKTAFKKAVTRNMEALSLNQRLRNTSLVLKEFLPADYKHTLAILKDTITQMPTGYTNLVFPDFVSQYGLNHYTESLEALKFFTKFGSSEFAIRVFLKAELTPTLKKMHEWAEDENVHVRRLASEGSRPRLPWSFKLDAIIENPALTKPILEKLNADAELYVRKSVANHLNDISKDSPDYALLLAKSWGNENPHTTWIIKRGCRSLIRKGDKKTLSLLGVSKQASVSIANFSLNKKNIKLNDRLSFEFDLTSTKKTVQKLIVQFCIHYVKQSGERSPKVFHLKELTLKAGERIHFTKSHRFQDFTTRKHFSGEHKLDIIVNGDVMISEKFKFTRA